MIIILRNNFLVHCFQPQTDPYPLTASAYTNEISYRPSSKDNPVLPRTRNQWRNWRFGSLTIRWLSILMTMTRKTELCVSRYVFFLICVSRYICFFLSGYLGTSLFLSVYLGTSFFLFVYLGTSFSFFDTDLKTYKYTFFQTMNWSLAWHFLLVFRRPGPKVLPTNCVTEIIFRLLKLPSSSVGTSKGSARNTKEETFTERLVVEKIFHWNKWKVKVDARLEFLWNS